MGTTIKLTAKRQATFPRKLCEELGLEPGDEIELAQRREKGEVCWLLKKRKPAKRIWAGALKRYAAKADDHSLEAVRASVAEGRRGEE